MKNREREREKKGRKGEYGHSQCSGGRDEAFTVEPMLLEIRDKQFLFLYTSSH